MNDNFYRAFEDRYLGSQELIKSRRAQYLPFVDKLKKIYQDGKVFDIGCGRGEWLSLMKEAGWDALGVDIDDGMLQGCLEKNLTVKKGDAVDFIRGLDSESHVVISAFHVVEHITFDELRTIVHESLRVLKPGGLLILETPNPENILVATNNFYIDPTHVRPIPHQLLSFLPEYYGFKRVKTIRMQESASLLGGRKPALIDVIAGVSPDYAIVAQKTAPQEHLRFFDEVFNKNYGLSLSDLADRYDQRVFGGVMLLGIIRKIFKNTWLWNKLRKLHKLMSKI